MLPTPPTILTTPTNTTFHASSFALLSFATTDLSDIFEAFREFSSGLFSLPECLWDGDCYDESSSSYCVDVCDPASDAWYGECPRESKTCFIDDEACFSCFGECRVFQCVYKCFIDFI